MAFIVMTTVLAEPNSGTTPRPSTTNTPSERAQRDEHDYRVRPRGNDGSHCDINNNNQTAANRQQHKNHCPTRTLFTFPHVSRPSGRGHSGIHSSNLRRKPSDGQGPAPKETAITWQQHKSTATARPVARKRSSDAPAQHGRPPRRSPQEPRTQDSRSTRHGPRRLPSEQSPVSHDQCRCEEEELVYGTREDKTKRDAEKKNWKQEMKPPTKRKKPQEKKRALPPPRSQ